MAWICFVLVLRGHTYPIFEPSQWILKRLRICLSSNFVIRNIPRKLSMKLTLEPRGLALDNSSQNDPRCHS